MSGYADRWITFAGVFALLLLAMTDFARASGPVDFNNPAFVRSGTQATSIPIGHVEFCHEHSGECGPNKTYVDVAELTDANWRQLVDVNNAYNLSVSPVPDADLYKVAEFWTYPRGYGDCEDYVLAKRRDLIALGWAPSTLLITVVRQRNGEGHAVLLARTDRGDLVLDNQESLIKVWSETPYRYLKRQSQFDSGKWVDLFDTRPGALASR